ncbi:MAG TPA: hypothetical protein DEF51_14305, partial [Myxococcales bacterium]|nr:hypothetical protein [Myxococcales bacterium]
ATGTCMGAEAGATCMSGQVCAGGSCATSCPAGQVDCGGRCVDPSTDPVYCGATGTCMGAEAGATCMSGQVCAGGACATSCPAGQVNCGGRCVDPSTDPIRCGASGTCTGPDAGVTCMSGQVCAAGSCETRCPSGQVDCGGRCVDPSTDPIFCGASGDCAGPNMGAVCASGEACSAGVCELRCPGGQIICGGRCVDPTSDRVYCGAAGDCTGVNDGVTCSAGQVCAAGSCELS